MAVRSIGLLDPDVFDDITHPEEADELLVADGLVRLELGGRAAGPATVAVALVPTPVVLPVQIQGVQEKLCFFPNSLQPLPHLHRCKRPSQRKGTVAPICW